MTMNNSYTSVFSPEKLMIRIATTSCNCLCDYEICNTGKSLGTMNEVVVDMKSRVYLPLSPLTHVVTLGEDSLTITDYQNG